MDLATYVIAALAGSAPDLKSDFLAFQPKIIHGTSGYSIQRQLQDLSAGPLGDFGVLLIDARGSNAGAVWEIQLGIFEEPAADLALVNWNWEVFEDSTAAGIQAQIDRWLAALRADPDIIAPWLMVLSQAGAGDGTRFLTIAAWLDFGGEPPAMAEVVGTMLRARPAPTPEPEPEPEPEPV